MIDSGPLLFSRYAYPPNALGYCGPADPGAMPGAAAAGDHVALTALAPRFEGAWPYLELIAGCNGIADPLDRRVVDAYWVGNSLLRRVPAWALASSLDERFSRRVGRERDQLAQAALTGLAHHSFHVFAVYPWMGLLRSGLREGPLRVLDQCRIRTGRVEAVIGSRVAVRSRPLGFDGARLAPGPETTEWARADMGLGGTGADLAVGDTVSLHWDWVCQRLAPADQARLELFTRINLAAVNALSRPGPAVVCDDFG